MKSLPLNKIYVLVIALLALAPMACKKETNDPNIDDRTINKTYTATVSGSTFSRIDSIDIDNDGTVDMFFNHSGNDSSQIMVAVFKDANVLTETINIQGDMLPVSRSLPSGMLIDASSTIWSNTTYSSGKSIRVGNLYDFGFHGKGDVYWALQLKKSTGNYLYGWIKINLSDDHRTLIIKEVAVQKVLNKSIKAGEK
jgi:hypothetical protein